MYSQMWGEGSLKMITALHKIICINRIICIIRTMGGREGERGVVKACKGWFGALFFYVCPFDREGGVLELFGQCPYRTSTFLKGLPLE